MNCLEILAPAGSWDSLVAGVRSGADAVYLATTRFGARASAKNFDLTQLEQALDFCHQRDVKVYLTMNTLVKDDELYSALCTAKKVAELGIDALIVQDVGFADRVHRMIPDLPLHASTQMSIHTPQGARFLYELGFRRVVLARELSNREIADIVNSCAVETEIFVHGALCMCVSGQCYFSAMLGSRSGNRGQCAQTCRLPFMVENGSGHDLSLKDMSVLEQLRQLRDIGVTSAKIEGRMKRPEYVASAVNVARQFLDNGHAEEESCQQLKNVFSRSGFTDGYYSGKRGKSMFGIRQKEDVISATNKVLNQIHALYKNEYQRIPVAFSFAMKKQQPVILKASVPEKNISAECFGDVAETAVNKLISQEKIVSQLSRTGNSPFKVTQVICDVDENITLPLSSLNAVRREMTDILTQKISGSYAKHSTFYDVPLAPCHNRTVRHKIPLRAVLSNVKELCGAISACEIVFVPESTPLTVVRNLTDKGLTVGLEVFGGMFGRENQIIRRMKDWKDSGIQHVLVNNIGAIPLCRMFGFVIHGNFRLNVMNTQSLQFFKDVGLTDVVASFEMTAEQINGLGDVLPVGAMVYGKLPLMLTRNCPGVNSATKDCKNCDGHGLITDRKNISFPYQCGGGCTQIFNSVPLYMGDRLQQIDGTDFHMLLFTDETVQQQTAVLNSIIHHKKLNGGYTRGLYEKGVL